MQSSSSTSPSQSLVFVVALARALGLRQSGSPCQSQDALEPFYAFTSLPYLQEPSMQNYHKLLFHSSKGLGFVFGLQGVQGLGQGRNIGSWCSKLRTFALILK